MPQVKHVIDDVESYRFSTRAGRKFALGFLRVLDDRVTLPFMAHGLQELFRDMDDAFMEAGMPRTVESLIKLAAALSGPIRLTTREVRIIKEYGYIQYKCEGGVEVMYFMNLPVETGE